MSSDGPTIEVDALLADLASYIVTSISVRGRSFFLESCPPPGEDNPGPCTLILYLADASRNDLLYGERDQAIPILKDGVRNSCVASGGSTACRGWEHNVEYVLARRLLGKARPGGVELDIGT